MGREKEKDCIQIGNVYLVLVSNSLLFFFSFPLFFCLFFFFRLPLGPSLLSLNSFASGNKGNISNRYRLFVFNSLMEVPRAKNWSKKNRKKTVGMLNTHRR